MRVGVDVGGTFTDLIAALPDGTIAIRKVASTPDDPSLGLFRAIDALGTSGQAIDVLIHGTTVATNALLERRGARVALVTTAVSKTSCGSGGRIEPPCTISRAITRRRWCRGITSSARPSAWPRAARWSP